MRRKMARSFSRILVTVAAAMAGFACASPGGVTGGGAEIALDRQASGSSIPLRRGQRLIVSLAGNPTTGYVWEVLQGGEPVLARQGDPQYTSSGKAIGSGGVYRFTFLAAAAGSATLKLVYRRPFEGQKPPADSFEVTVLVAE